ncbi:unnamed protein product [Clonostachys rosea]|uniref:Uncharacterized protein n=1 Tax=Bionectria ochroleuca TaxID=29856 RepID=A0ABY6U504_BIOOC|nr:unnamed protein product [Clonostachys rosea]
MSEPDQKCRDGSSQPNEDSSKMPDPIRLSIHVSDNKSDHILAGVSNTAGENEAPSSFKMLEAGGESCNNLDDRFEDESENGFEHDGGNESQGENENKSANNLEDHLETSSVLSPPKSMYEFDEDDEAENASRPGILVSPQGQLVMDREHECVPVSVTTAWHLVRDICHDVFPQDYHTLDDYFFTPLLSQGLFRDAQMLLSVYSDLVKGFHISSPQLHLWKEAKQIYNNTVRLYNRYPRRLPVASVNCLMHHHHVFLEQDKSEVFDFDAYLRANDITRYQFYVALMSTL